MRLLWVLCTQSAPAAWYGHIRVRRPVRGLLAAEGVVCDAKRSDEARSSVCRIGVRKTVQFRTAVFCRIRRMAAQGRQLTKTRA